MIKYIYFYLIQLKYLYIRINKIKIKNIIKLLSNKWKE